MPSPRFASLSPRYRLRRLILLGLMVSVAALPAWLSLGDTHIIDATRPAGSFTFPSEHLAPGAAAATEPSCESITNKKRRKRCLKRNPILLAAGDIARCDGSGDEATAAEATAALLATLPGTVAALGDLVYESGTPEEFAQCYDPSWGRFKARTRPAPGNHDYETAGAAGYFGYFGSAATPLDPKCRTSCRGYYSYDLGSWHIVVLNTTCSEVGSCQVGSPQEQWLRRDLEAHPTTCTLAYWHHPRFSFGKFRDAPLLQPLWQALYDHGAEVVLTGHDHNYQRYMPLDATGAPDPERGIREFVVGTGGANFTPLDSPRPPNAEAGNDETFGILKLNLHPTSYDWTFIPIAGQSYSDSGSGTCH
jgi:acid phosphatase type 7